MIFAPQYKGSAVKEICRGVILDLHQCETDQDLTH